MRQYEYVAALGIKHLVELNAMQRTLSQNSRFHTLLTLRKFDKEDKQELVKACTGGRTTSSAEMTQDEMAQAIKLLDDEQATSLKKMRAKIIGIYRDIIEYPEPKILEQFQWDALNTFLKKKFKNPLHKLTYKDLVKAVTGVEKWRDSTLNTVVKSLLNDTSA